MRRGLAFVLGSIVVTIVAAACSSASSSGGGDGGGGGSGAVGIGGTGGGGGVNLDGGGGTGALTGCAKQTFGGELVPVDMFMMFDRSGSMQKDGKWSSVTSAVKKFVALPGLDKLGMGLAFFPINATGPIPTTCATNQDCGFYGPCMPPPFAGCQGSLLGMKDSCVSTDYQTPKVEIEAFPGVSSKIIAALDGTTPGGDSTPAAPALEGAIDHATIWQAAHLDRVVVVILATDGEPNNCTPNEVKDVAGHAAEGLKQTPSIKTFVIGVGDLTVLNQVAAAGGTDKAIIVSSTNAEKEFLDALNKIRGAVGCQYVIPTGAKADPKKVNVYFTPEDGSPGTLIKQSKGAADCVGQVGWYYDNPNAPTQIQLCPAACDLVTNKKGKVEVVVGCDTQIN
ncbi:MAG: hypothetical protein L6Q84_27145 [Polyangiaceae bacterium]|nr:hypothetical protein [Polyangiaceae bacterium]